MEAVLQKNRAIEGLAEIGPAQQSIFRIGCGTTAIIAVLQRMIEVQTTGNRGNVVKQIVVVPQPRLRPLGPIIARLNVVCSSRAGTQGVGLKSLPSATLAF